MKNHILCALKHYRIVRFLLPQERELTWKRNTTGNKILCSVRSLNQQLSNQRSHLSQVWNPGIFLETTWSFKQWSWNQEFLCGSCIVLHAVRHDAVTTEMLCHIMYHLLVRTWQQILLWVSRSPPPKPDICHCFCTNAAHIFISQSFHLYKFKSVVSGSSWVPQPTREW